MDVTREAMVRESFARQGLMGTIGAEISSITSGQLEIHFGFKPTLTQQHGFVHAGVVASVMDSACGYAAMSVAPENYEVLTVEFKVNLLAPALGKSFVVRSMVKRAGKTLTICAADAFAVSDAGEKMIATMLATMINRAQ